jgi:hypothetical protein
MGAGMTSETPSTGAPAQTKILAKEMNDSESKDAMLRIAEDYEQLAQWVENWAPRRLPKN